jgi:hypothetical protein
MPSEALLDPVQDLHPLLEEIDLRLRFEMTARHCREVDLALHPDLVLEVLLAVDVLPRGHPRDAELFSIFDYA